MEKVKEAGATTRPLCVALGARPNTFFVCLSHNIFTINKHLFYFKLLFHFMATTNLSRNYYNSFYD